ncbi:unnamed protein product [Rotaria sp. Silwood2]|nr:unnamed protein product [Rotaria sp. Silwood2]CAF4084133.1 unnamed protein product [Rotaria sp. Silwood2]
MTVEESSPSTIVFAKSSLKAEQQIIFEQLISQLNIRYSNAVDETTTHVKTDSLDETTPLIYSLTLKVIQATARRLPIISIQWLVASITHQIIVPSQIYEIFLDNPIYGYYGGFLRSCIPRSQGLFQGIEFRLECPEQHDRKKNEISALKQHKKDLATVNPEFYKFLRNEDESLPHFNVNEDDEPISDDDPEQQIHQLPEQLIEMEPSSDKKNQPTLNTIRHVTRAFGLAVQSVYGGADVSADTDQANNKKEKETIKTGAIDDQFNVIVRLCLKQLLPAIYRFLRIKIATTSKLKPETSSNWKYIEQIMKKIFD